MEFGKTRFLKIVVFKIYLKGLEIKVCNITKHEPPSRLLIKILCTEFKPVLKILKILWVSSFQKSGQWLLQAPVANEMGDEDLVEYEKYILTFAEPVSY